MNVQLGKLSSISRSNLKKVAASIPSLRGMGDAAKFLGNYAAPVGAGAGVGAYGYSQGQSPLMATGEGLGTAMLLSPKGWKNVYNAAKSSNDPLTEFGIGTGKALVRKASPIAIAGGLDYLPHILKNVDQTISNTAAGTSAFAGAAPNIASNIVDTTGNANKITKDFANQSGTAASSVVSNLQGMQDTMNDISHASQALSHGAEQVAPALGRIADSTDTTAKAVTSGIDYAKSLPGKIKNMVDWNSMTPTQKLVTGGAGALGIGAGGLLLSRMLRRDEDKQQKNQQ
jgi:hypothetical protein